MTEKKKSSSISNPKPHFSKKEALNFGFDLTKKNLVFFIGVFVIMIAVSVVSWIFQMSASVVKQPLLYALLNIASFILNSIIGMGVIKITLEILDKKQVKFSDLFYTKPIVNFILGSIIRGVITVIGFILLIIPGIIFSIRLQYVTYLIVDKDMTAVDAVYKSWAMTKGNSWNLFFFGILLCLVNLLGFLCLLVGLFITVPLTMLATTHVYRKLLLQSKAA
jgi:uncharacterized membrane protein